MINIDILKLGDVNSLNIQEIKNFATQSRIFKINEVVTSPNAEILSQPRQTLLDADLIKIARHTPNVNFTLIVVERPLEGNYFSRRLDEKNIAVTINGLLPLKFHEGISMEKYMLRFILGFSTMCEAYGGLKQEAGEVMQLNPTGCLFDMAIDKTTLQKFFLKPKLSTSAESILEGKTLPDNYLGILKKEIQYLRIGYRYRAIDKSKKYPFVAAVLAFVFALVMYELLGSYLYDLFGLAPDDLNP